MPGKTVQHLSLDEVLEIHNTLIEHFGGLAGIRDIGLLDSALYRARSGYYEDLAEMAAALFESLIMNHPFLDGNKRVAFFAADVFLRLNGYQLKARARPAHRFLIGLLEKNQCDYDHLLPWIRKSLTTL